TKVKSGLRFNIPSGYELQIRSRSGLASKNNLTVANQPGTIDNYTGEVILMMINNSTDVFKTKKYDRIAQGKIAIVPEVILRKVKKVKESLRGSRGMGSTGV
ncbi:MAG: dUTP diphosphatase, partial [Desulfuromonadales bacterium]|nr:dUTP diphosphatase [Desulfuromonadales bacterium]